MKTTTTKILGLILAAVLLVCATVMGTLAYLSDTDTVTNTFTVGNVAITLDEAPVDLGGTVIPGDRVKENTYKLIPGHSYTKDPTVHVDDASEDCWLFVTVTNEIAAIEGGSEKVADQMKTLGWTLVDGTADTYAYATVVSAGADVTVFETFTVDGTVDGNTLAAYADKQITVTAIAIQADGLATAGEAWAAYTAA